MLEIAAIKFSLLSSLMTGIMTTVSPYYAQLDSLAIASDSCSNLCMNVDVKSYTVHDSEPGEPNYQ